MWQQIKQVWLTYREQEALFFGILILVPICVVVSLLYAISADDATSVFMGTILVVVGFLSLQIATTAKWQFTHPRARMTPGYKAAHLSFMFGMLVIGVIALPLFMAWVADFDSLATVSLAAVLACCVIWPVYWNSLFLLLVLLNLLPATFFLNILLEPWSIFGELDRLFQYGLVQAGALIAGWSGLLLWLWRVSELHEESPEYQPQKASFRKWSFQRGQQTPPPYIDYRKSRVPLLAQFMDHWLDRSEKQLASSRGSIVSLLRYGFGSSSTGLSMVVLAVLLAGMWHFMLKITNHDSASGNFLNFFFLTSFQSWLPTLMASGKMFAMLPQMNANLVRPPSRGQLIDGLLKALASDCIVMWLLLHAALLLVMLFFPGPYEPQVIVAFMVNSLAIQPALFAVGLRFCTGYSQVLAALAIYAVYWASQAVFYIAWVWHGPWGFGFFVLAELAMALLGLAMVWGLRRRWLNMEFTRYRPAAD